MYNTVRLLTVDSGPNKCLGNLVMLVLYQVTNVHMIPSAMVCGAGFVASMVSISNRHHILRSISMRLDVWLEALVL